MERKSRPTYARPTQKYELPQIKIDMSPPRLTDPGKITAPRTQIPDQVSRHAHVNNPQNKQSTLF